MTDIEQLIARVATKLDEINAREADRKDPLDTETVNRMIAEAINGLSDNEEFRRKMRWEKPADALIGTRYAAHKLGIADVEFLYDLQNSLRGQSRRSGGVHPGPSQELENVFKAVSDAYYLPAEQAREIDRRALDDVFPRRSRRDVQAFNAALRAMDSAESGYGSQLIGAQYVGDLWDAARPASRVFPLIETFEMTAPTAYLPVEADLPEMLFVAENPANNSSEYDTDKTGSNRVQVDAKKFVLHQMWSGEMEEDSIIPFVPYLRRQAALSLAHYTDSLIVNGDTTNAGTGNINLDDADPADTKHYLAFDGIRHAAIVDNTANTLNVAGAHTSDTFLTLKGLMEQATAYHPLHWGFPTRMEDLVYLMDFSSYIASLKLDEVLTLDKYGSGASILNGELGRIWGHPIIPTQVVSLTEADGKVSTTGSNNTLGQIVAFNRNGFRAGWRRRVQLETERLPGRDQTRLIYSLRMGFGRYSVTGAASGIEAVAVGRNITV